MADVFISYKRSDRARVQQIERLLRENKLSVWFDARLELGRGEGFDAEIEREVTSAASVLACWTPEAVGSVYVRAEAKKGLERGVLVPVFLEPCSLPIPFNDVDAADLSEWGGDGRHPAWQRVIARVKELKTAADRSREAAMVRSAATYGKIDQKIFPGTLKILTQKIAAIHEFDAQYYKEDIDALLAWMESVAGKEKRYVVDGYREAERRWGHASGPWGYWDSGEAAKRATEIKEIISALARIIDALNESKRLLGLPAP